MSEERTIEAGGSPINVRDNSWGVVVDVAVCDQCHWAFVVERGCDVRRCPYCVRGSLAVAPLEQSDWADYARPPELYLPYRDPVKVVNQAVTEFAKGLWFPPADLTPQNLIGRARQVFLPVWLVDSHVEAAWDAEMGYDYQVVSHQDYYNDDRSGWESREVKETRVRWEPRLGRMVREYANIAAPALEENRTIIQQTGAFQIEAAQPYAPELLKNAFVRLPDRPTADAWPDAVDPLKSAAAGECCQAAGADHVREFHWEPAFSKQNWTLLLLPVSLTFYLDDDGNPQQLMLNGQSGRMSGRRRASMKRAQQAALWILAAATLIFILSLGLVALGIVLPPVMAIGGLGVFLSIMIALGAIVPPAIAWNVNRKVDGRR